jgi:hypothetical protein
MKLGDLVRMRHATHKDEFLAIFIRYRQRRSMKLNLSGFYCVQGPLGYVEMPAVMWVCIKEPET